MANPKSGASSPGMLPPKFIRPVALAEAALWSGLGASLALDDDPLTLFGEVGGQVLAALPAEQVEPDPTGSEIEVRRIGTVGGDALFGIPLEKLGAAHEGGR